MSSLYYEYIQTNKKNIAYQYVQYSSIYNEI